MAASISEETGLRMELMKCPACGAPIKGEVTSRVIVCEYCESQFVLDENLANAVMGTDELDEYAQYYYQWESMAHFAADACSDFLDDLGDDSFDVSKRVYDGLGIQDGEEVYLIHDDSMLGRGKNGFAITEYGLYCREMGEPAAWFLDWASYAHYDRPYIDGSYILVNDVRICYCTNDSDLLPQLLDLYDLLHEASYYLVEWEEEEQKS